MRLVQQQLAPPAQLFAFMQSVTEGSRLHVVVPNEQYMPVFRGTKVPHTQPGPATAVQIDIEPKPSTQHSYGNTVLASPWMGGGKTTAKRDYRKELMSSARASRCTRALLARRQRDVEGATKGVKGGGGRLCELSPTAM